MLFRQSFRTLRVVLLFAALIGTTAGTVQANFIYNIGPVTLSGGYAITGGFIETDINSGTLTTANIVDYQVIVTGLYPYTYTPSNPSAGKQANNVIITPTSISVTPPATSGGGGNFLAFTASDSSNPDVTFGVQNLFWRGRRVSTEAEDLVTYDYRDIVDSNPLIMATQSALTENSLIIATTTPEPAALWLALPAAAGVWWFLRRRGTPSSSPSDVC